LKKTILIVIAYLLLACLFENTALGCDCKPRPEIGVSDWNDIGIIFKARLSVAQKSFQFGVLTFEEITMYKGTLPSDSLTLFFQPHKSHTLLHAIKKFTIGEEWIVFAKQEEIEGRIFYRLVDTNNKHYCALSRPLLKTEDAYLNFLDYMVETANGYRQFYDTEGKLLSEGRYDQKIPTGHWKYYLEERIIYEGPFLQGLKNGHWLTYSYNRKGKQALTKKEVYENGKIKGSYNYALNGDLRWSLETTDHQKIYSYYRKNKLYNKLIYSFEGKILYSADYKKGKVIREEYFD